MVCRECGAYNPDGLTHCRVCAAKLVSDEAAAPVSESEKPQHTFAKSPAWPSKPFSGTIEKPVFDPAKAAAKKTEKKIDEIIETADDVTEALIDDVKEEIAAEIEAAEEKAEMVEEKIEEKTAAVVDEPTKAFPSVRRFTQAADETPIKDETDEKAEAPATRTVKSGYTPRFAYVPRQSSSAAIKAEPKEKRLCSVCGREMLSDAPFCAWCGSHEGLPGSDGLLYTAGKSTRRPKEEEPKVEEKKGSAIKPEKKPAKNEKPAKAVEDEDLFDEDLEDEEDDFIPIRSRKKEKAAKAEKEAAKKKARRKDEYDEDDFEDEEFDEEDEEYEEDEESRGTNILFWILIVLLIGCILFFGAYIAKKNFGSVGNMIAAITGKEQPAEPVSFETEPDTEAAAPEIAAYVDDSKMYTCTVKEDFDATTGTPIYTFVVYAPTGSTVKLNTVTELMNGGTMQIPSNDQVMISVPRAAYLPNTPLDSSVISITPGVTVITADGETVELDVPTMTQTVDQLEIRMITPDMETITNTFHNDPINVEGYVKDYTVKVYINGEETTVYLNSDEQTSAEWGGTFKTVYNPTGSGTETITVTAEKENCATATKTITVEPYVMQEGTLTLTADPSVKSFDLTSDENGALTIAGTAMPGGTITATCEDANVTGGTIVCGEDGSFKLPIAITQPGIYTLSMSAACDGYTAASADCIVERVPSESSSTFRKNAKNLNTSAYEAIKSGSVVTGSYQFTGKVTEILESESYERVKMTLSSGEEVLVTNRSAKNRLDKDDLKKKKQVAGTIVGVDEETGLPHLWVWFVWNAN